MADAYKTEKAFMLENMKHSKRRAEGEYKDLSQKLRGENQNLKNQLKKESQKNIEMVAQLQNELDRKTKQCENYHSELTEINEGLEAREAKMMREMEIIKLQSEKKVEITERNLEERIRNLKDQLEQLNYFKNKKAEIEATILAAKNTIEQQASRFKEEIENLERKALHDKELIQRRAQNEVNLIQRQSKEAAEREIDLESKHIRQRNLRIQKDLVFHEKHSDKLRAENVRLLDRVRKLTRDAQLMKQQEEEYSKQGVLHSKHIKKLTEKGRNLEISLTQVVKDFSIEKSQWNKEKKQMQTDANVLSDKFKKRLKSKDRELKKLKDLATKILHQRGEVEQFFLDSLSQVKMEIKDRRKQEYEEIKSDYDKSISSLSKSSRKSFKYPKQPAKTLDMHIRQMKNAWFHDGDTSDIDFPVELEDLTLADRERVLKLLFHKINSTHPYGVPDVQLPPELRNTPDIGSTFVTQQREM